MPQKNKKSSITILGLVFGSLLFLIGVLSIAFSIMVTHQTGQADMVSMLRMKGFTAIILAVICYGIAWMKR